MATENDSVSTDAIGTLVVVLAVAVVAVGLAVTALVRNEQNDLALARETQANLRPLRELRASQQAELGAAPAWVNRDTGTITLPIDRAMELVVERARNLDVAPSVAAEPATGEPSPVHTNNQVVGASSATAPSSPSAVPSGAMASDPEHGR